jgi:hypothetical protein
MADHLAYQDIDPGTEDVAQPVEGGQGQGQGAPQCGLLLITTGSFLPHVRHYDMCPNVPATML